MPQPHTVLLAVLALLAAGALAGSAGAAAPAKAKPARSVPMLLVLDAGAGTLRSAGAGRYTLTLTAARPRTIAFTDQPMRVAQTVPTKALGLLWGHYFHAGQKPNAALNVLARDTKTYDTVVLELGTPKVKGATVTFPARILTSAGGRLASFDGRRRTTAPAAFTNASLFIDDAGACTVDVDGGFEILVPYDFACADAQDVVQAWLDETGKSTGEITVGGTTWSFNGSVFSADGSFNGVVQFIALDGTVLYLVQ